MKKFEFVIMLSVLMLILQSCNTSDELIALRRYYRTTEILLDSIAIQNPDYFLDCLIEQDIYKKYLGASVPLSKIKNN